MAADEEKVGWVSDSMSNLLIGKLNKGPGATDKDGND